MTLIRETPSPGVGDVGELYGSLARRLEQIVRLDVRASDAVIEDACQFAWCRLLRHSHRVHRETVMAWLARTAVHEAFKLLWRDRRELSLDVALDDGEHELAWAVDPATPDAEHVAKGGILPIPEGLVGRVGRLRQAAIGQPARGRRAARHQGLGRRAPDHIPP